MSLNGRLETEIKIKQTSRRVKFENPQRSVHIVYHPTPGHFLAHQKACCERRFRHMSHHFLLFCFPRMSWWKAAILLFTLECVLLSRLLLNSAMARSSIRICCVLFFFLFHTPTLCVSSLTLSSSSKGSVYHFCLMCGEWIKQSVTSTWGSSNAHMTMENKISASIWITQLTNTHRAYINIYCTYGPRIHA